MRVLKTAVLALSIATLGSAYDTPFNESRKECVTLHGIFISDAGDRGKNAYNMFVRIKCENVAYNPPKWKTYYFEGKEISKKKERRGCNRGCEETSPLYKGEADV